MKDKLEEIIKQYGNYIGNNLKNSPSPGSPGTTLQKNPRETFNMKEYMALVWKSNILYYKNSSEMWLCKQSISKAYAEY